MQDVVKTSQSASGAAPRRRRRKRNLSLYYLMIFLISAFVLFVLSRTVLFRINEYVVTGNQRYSTAQILSAGDLRTGKNMYSLSTDKVEDRIKSSLIYVENVTVKRKLPDKLIVTIEEAEPFACCQYEGRYAVISRSGRYLETEQASPRTDIMQVIGLDLINVALGESLASEDPNKETIIVELFDSIDKICPGKITYINITDRTDIVLGYDGRIEVEFGSSLDYEYKLRYITAIIEDNLDHNATGRLIYHSASAGASFITNEDIIAMEEDLNHRREMEAAIGDENAGDE